MHIARLKLAAIATITLMFHTVDARATEVCRQIFIQGGAPANVLCHDDSEDRTRQARIAALPDDSCRSLAQDGYDSAYKTCEVGEKDLEAGDAVMAAARCPTDHEAILKLRRREFARCEKVAVISPHRPRSAEDYIATDDLRTWEAGEAAWDRKVAACRRTPGCAIIETRIDGIDQ